LALLGQDAPRFSGSLDISAYESFFQAVSRLTPGKALGHTVNPAAASTPDRQTMKFVEPTLEDALGITVEEAQALRAIASDCAEKTSTAHQAMKPLVLELRLAALSEETPPQDVIRRYAELNRQRAQLVVDHIRELESRFGEARFSRMEAFLRERKDSESFFPAVPQGAPLSVK